MKRRDTKHGRSARLFVGLLFLVWSVQPFGSSALAQGQTGESGRIVDL